MTSNAFGSAQHEAHERILNDILGQPQAELDAVQLAARVHELAGNDEALKRGVLREVMVIQESERCGYLDDAARAAFVNEINNALSPGFGGRRATTAAATGGRASRCQELVDLKIIKESELLKACRGVDDPNNDIDVLKALAGMRRTIGLSGMPVLSQYQLGKIDDGGPKQLKVGNRVLLHLMSGPLGGMAEVYCAWHPNLNRLEAVKILRFKGEAPREAVERFRQEAALMVGLASSDGVPHVHEAEVLGDLAYIAMEYVDGENLYEHVQQVVERGEYVDFERALRWAITIANILASAHKNGVIHRDVKPANIMLTKVGHLKLLDLGIASLRSELAKQGPAQAEPSFTTNPGYVLGTPGYMPPEQWADSHSVDHYTDTYALGCCLYFFLTGSDLFCGTTVEGIRAAHLRGANLDFESIRQDVPLGIRGILEKMVATRPENRYASAADVANALQTFLDGTHLASNSNNSIRCLIRWQENFKIDAVCVGDRSEFPPHTSADILAASASTSDLMYLGELGIRAPIRSHKILKIADLDGQRKILRGHFLVVGSPAVNFVSRLVNQNACFRFALTPESRELEARFDDELKEIKFNRGALEAFLNPITTAQKARIQDLRFMLNQFAKGGYVDPIDYRGLRGERKAHNDFGVVTLCLNPFDDSKIVILAAGTGGPGTTAALKLLSRPNAFDKHPLGGVFRVEVSTEAGWHDRYDWLDPKWDTPPYTLEEYKAGVVDLVKRSNVPESQSLSADEGHRLLHLVDLLKCLKEESVACVGQTVS